MVKICNWFKMLFTPKKKFIEENFQRIYLRLDETTYRLDHLERMLQEHLNNK